MKNLIKISLMCFLMVGAFACTKDSESAPETNTTENETVTVEPTVSDRATDNVTFTFLAGDAVDIEYKLTNLATGVTTTKYFYSMYKSNVTFAVPQESCVKASFKARRLYGVTPLSWTWKRGTCTTLTGSTTVNAAWNAAWSTITPVVITSSACHCN